jgi:Domain of unknown function (DUF4272)
MAAPDDFSFTPPLPGRVAARALVLAAISCRGLIEKDAGNPGAEELRQGILPWLDSIGAAEELEPAETNLLSTPLGGLDHKKTINMSWQSEGMVVLAWALGYAELPAAHVECEPSDIANGMGFLGERKKTPLHSPQLRESAEIEAWADTYLTLHWRLRQFSLSPVTMDFVDYVSKCQWAALQLDHLEIQDRELAIDGVRLDNLESEAFRRTLGITRERHTAFNWLLGFEPIYSEVPADT